MKSEIAKRIESADWNELYPVLILFAETRLRNALKTKGKPVIEGLDANVLLDRAIDKTLDGTRRWKYGDVSLENHLKGVIRSDISAFFKKDIARSVAPPIWTESGPINTIEILGDNHLRPDTTVSDDEHSTLLNEHISAFRESVADDSELVELLDAYDAGYTKPADIAGLTDIDPRRIDELKRKLLTKYLRFTSNYSGVLERADLVRGHR